MTRAQRRPHRKEEHKAEKTCQEGAIEWLASLSEMESEVLEDKVKKHQGCPSGGGQGQMDAEPVATACADALAGGALPLHRREDRGRLPHSAGSSESDSRASVCCE